MRFKIAPHAGHAPGHAPPADAVEKLMEYLGPRREAISFSMGPSYVIANWNAEMSSSATHDERLAIGRRAVLEIVNRVAEHYPDLDPDWFAISELP